jgi:hypothetical protein
MESEKIRKACFAKLKAELDEETEKIEDVDEGSNMDIYDT